jgi:hypothetical protein
MRLQCRSEILFHAQVQVECPSRQPYAASTDEMRRLWDFGETEHADIEAAGLVFGSRRDRHLNVVEAVNTHNEVEVAEIPSGDDESCAPDALGAGSSGLSPKFSRRGRRRNSAPAPQAGVACRLQRHVMRLRSSAIYGVTVTRTSPQKAFAVAGSLAWMRAVPAEMARTRPVSESTWATSGAVLFHCTVYGNRSRPPHEMPVAVTVNSCPTRRVCSRGRISTPSSCVQTVGMSTPQAESAGLPVAIASTPSMGNSLSRI